MNTIRGQRAAAVAEKLSPAKEATMFLRISIAFFLFVVIAGVCKVAWNAKRPAPYAVEIDVINDDGDAMNISASGGSDGLAGRWWDGLTKRNNVAGVRATETNLGGRYREYTFICNECLETDITLSGTFAEGSLCKPNGTGALVSAYKNGTALNIAEKDNGDGTCSYVITR